MSVSRHAVCLLALIAVAPCGVRAGEFPLWEAGAASPYQLSGISRLGSAPHLRVTRPLPGLSRRAPESGSRQHAWTVPQERPGGIVRERKWVDSGGQLRQRRPRRMPDLDPTLELGPNLLLRSCASPRSIEIGLRMPVRTVIATDFPTRRMSAGYSSRRSTSTFRDTWLGEGWNLAFAAGPLYGDRRYHNYFYGVAPEFATPQRPAFNAAGGYAGARYSARSASASLPSGSALFARWDTLAGAVFEASPLVRQKDSFAAGFAIAWYLGNRRRWSRRKSECRLRRTMSKSLQERRQQPGTAGQDATMPQGSPDREFVRSPLRYLARPARLATNTSFYISATCTSAQGVPWSRWSVPCCTRSFLPVSACRWADG